MAPEPRRLLLALGTVTLAATLVYANSLRNGFALDDITIIEGNEAVHGLEHLPEAVTGPYWPNAAAERALYRPLVLATYAADWELWGGRPFGFHLGNVLLHAAVSALVLLLLTNVGATLPAAWAGAMVFAVHPVHVEAVANVVGRAELLMALAFLGACLVYLRGGRTWATGLGVGLLYLLAMGAKENGVMLPAALLLLQGLRADGPRDWYDQVRRRWRVFAAAAAALVAYFLLRWAAIGTFLGVETPPWFWGMPDRVRILTAIRVWPEYLRLMLLPIDLVPDYGPGVIVPEWSPVGALVLMGAALGILAAVVAWRARRSAPLLSGGVAWFAVTILPVAGILFPVGVILAERTLYLPSVGLAMAVAAAARWALARRDGARAALVGLLLVLGLAAARTWTANPVWRDSLTVMNHLLDHHPANFRAQWALGNHFTARGDTAQALGHLEIATRMAPGYVALRGQYGELLLETGRYRAAAAQLDTAIQVMPAAEGARRLLAVALLRLDEPRQAAELAAEGLRLDPDADLLGVRSRALARAGDFAAAAAARRQALQRLGRAGTTRRDPSVAAQGAPAWAQWTHLAALELLAGDTAAAGRALDRARATAPEGWPVPTMRQLQELSRPSQRAAIPLW